MVFSILILVNHTQKSVELLISHFTGSRLCRNLVKCDSNFFFVKVTWVHNILSVHRRYNLLLEPVVPNELCKRFKLLLLIFSQGQLCIVNLLKMNIFLEP